MVAGLILHYIAKYIFINGSQWPLHYVNASKQQSNDAFSMYTSDIEPRFQQQHNKQHVYCFIHD